MAKRASLGLIAFCLAVLAGAAPASSQVAGGGKPTGYAPGRLLVKLKPGTPVRAGAAVHARVGAQVVRAYRKIGWQLVKLPPALSVASAIGRYRQMAEVAAVEPDYRQHADSTLPNDPQLPNNLWGMHRIGAPAAWDMATGTTNVVVAVIDTGVDYTHEDLAANMWQNPGEIPGNGRDDDGNGYVDDVYGIDTCNRDSDPMDDNAHGTHVSGTIGGVGNNGLGVVGVNWTTRIMALKFLDAGGSGWTSDAIACYEYVMIMKERGVNIRVINNSWGGGGYEQSLKDAIDAAGDADILSCCAAGNDATDNDTYPHYPSNYDSPSIVAVTAIDWQDNQAFNYGAASVDIAAPGCCILSCVPGSDYESFGGTSMATPHVAGAAALVLSVHPDLSASALKHLLMNTAEPLPSLAGKCVTGGLLNLPQALTGKVIEVDEPRGGEYWGTGTQQTIRWSSAGVSGNVSIELSRDGGQTYEVLFASTANDGEETWTVAGDATLQARVRITSLGDPTVADVSDADFGIGASYTIHGRVTENGSGVPGVTVRTTGDVQAFGSSAPGSGIYDLASTEDSITIAQGGRITGVTVSVQINHSYIGDLQVWLIHPDGTAVLLHDRSGGTTANLWTVYPDQTPTVEPLETLYGKPCGGTWKLRIYDAAYYDEGALISWSLLLRGQSGSASTATAADGTYTLASLPEGTYTVAPVRKGNSFFSPEARTVPLGPDQTDVDFEAATLNLTVAAPNGGEVWHIGTTQTVSWTSANAPGSVMIELSTDGGRTFVPLCPNTPNDGSENVAVPDAPTDEALIRISSIAYPSVWDVSDSPFSIGGFGINGTVRSSGAGLPGVIVQATGSKNVSTGAVSPAAPIPDGEYVESVIRVGRASEVVTGVHVTVDITHWQRGDLEVSLIHPDGTTVLLHNRTGGSADHLRTTYPDWTVPAESLSVLNGKPMAGDWRLRVRDLKWGDTGTLNSWSLTLEGQVARTAVTASDGTYVLDGLPTGTYTVSPSLPGYLFTPATRSVSVGPDQSGVDFDRIDRALLNPGVTPASGDVNTTFRFSVTYVNSADTAPSFAYVAIINPNGTTSWKTMTTTDTTYTDGSVFTYSTKLPVGTYSYYFYFGIGTARLQTATAPGPVVNDIFTLTEGAVDPPEGDPDTLFRFSVKYTQLGNQAPQYAYVAIINPNGTTSWRTMTTTDTTYSDGSVFTYSTKLPVGNYSYYFYFRAAGKTLQTAQMAGPVVHAAPALGDGSVSPSTGTRSVTNFTFSVKYTHWANQPPTSAYVAIINPNGTTSWRTMTTTDTTYSDGSVFTFQTRLGASGSYRYYFYFKVGSKTLQTATANGPTVN